MARTLLGNVKGKDGVDGRSAYDIWLDLGNVGTEQEFIDYLKDSFGVNQSWQKLLSQRSKDVTYYNTTNKFIVVSIIPNSSTISKYYLTIDDVKLMFGFGYNGYGEILVPIPVGCSYMFSVDLGVCDILEWNEMR